MRKKLTAGALLVILLTVLVLGGNQLIIQLFTRFTDKLILENNELYALEELKGSLGKILIHENHYLISHEDFQVSLEDAEEKLAFCQQELSQVHKGKEWESVELMFFELRENVEEVLRTNTGDEVMLHIISHQAMDLITTVESLIGETVSEITEYEERSQKARIHGTVTVIALGFVLILVLSLWSYRLIRSITRPIGQLVDTTRKISEGNRDLRVRVDSKDEFLLLANSFNGMLDTLNRTTISEKYLNNILNHLYGALMVTDANGQISSVNLATTRLLNCREEEMIGRGILHFFKNGNDPGELENRPDSDLEKLAGILSERSIMTNSEGKEILVHVTAVVLKDKKNEAEGMVVVGHDLTEEKKNQDRMEKMRKERRIAIHEAQEQERFRISRDLHDGLGQLLTGISYSLQQSETSREIGSYTAEMLQTQINTAIQESKNIAQNLTPIVLKDFGLPAAIENLVQRSNQLDQTFFSFNSYSFDARIDTRLEKSLFRICQEAVNNIIKHAEASKATIELYKVEDMIVLVVEDNGKGFDPKTTDRNDQVSGVGLISMKERVDAFGGEFTIHSEPGKGAELLVEMPCRKDTRYE
jgi:PAS domain S-box-containing protein